MFSGYFKAERAILLPDSNVAAIPDDARAKAISFWDRIAAKINLLFGDEKEQAVNMIANSARIWFGCDVLDDTSTFLQRNYIPHKATNKRKSTTVLRASSALTNPATTWHLAAFYVSAISTCDTSSVIALVFSTGEARR
ncbi:unnamed protein product [Onchocerca flexuosa]|uniref:Peptidase_M13 domain-containing protein n=1 Tax=Onchocerca flexuosa TaxID=387005 RepID=A0A183H507_9BILA|nr:unnamed protein product [Onchocerca flexuosa]